MSRIGKKPIDIPANVKVDIAADGTVTVKGPKGTLSEQVKGGFAAFSLQHGVALAGEQKFQQFADLRVVVHKEDGGAHGASFLIIAVCSEIWPYVFLKNP